MTAGQTTVAVGASAAALALSWVLTGRVRHYAAARLLDVPNARSSHAAPTPRGGGLAVVVCVLAGILALALTGVLPFRLAMALGPGAALVAAVGWLDDHDHVPARWRSLVQFAAAFWALAWLGWMPSLRLGFTVLPLGPLGAVVGALGIVWVTNLYNFMDGIDGIAAGQAVSVGAAAAVLLTLHGAPELAAVALLVACASGGFLLWNWHPARIFMGDVGSGTLGYLFAVLALASENTGGLPILAWTLLMAVFVADATITLVRRLHRRERVYEAHRSHAYQRAVQAGLSHARVSGSVIAINLVLALFAAAAWAWPHLLLPLFVAGFALLILVYLKVESLRPM